MSTRWLAIIAVAAVLLASGLYGYRTGWFGGGDDEEDVPYVPGTGEATRPDRPVDARENAVARAAWGVPDGAPQVGIGAAVSADAPTHAALTVKDDRAEVGIRVPRAKGDGKPYNGYFVELRAGDSRVWSTTVPAAGASADREPIGLSINVAALRASGADTSALSVVVGGTAMRKGDTLGIARLELPAAP